MLLAKPNSSHEDEGEDDRITCEVGIILLYVLVSEHI